MTTPDIPDLTPKEFVAMSLLVPAGRKMYGLELVEHSGGELKRGTVYVTLNRLEDKGYITSEKEPTAPGIAQPRRLYKVTGLGERAFRAVEISRATLKQAFAL